MYLLILNLYFVKAQKLLSPECTLYTRLSLILCITIVLLSIISWYLILSYKLYACYIRIAHANELILISFLEESEEKVSSYKFGKL